MIVLLLNEESFICETVALSRETKGALRLSVPDSLIVTLSNAVFTIPPVTSWVSGSILPNLPPSVVIIFLYPFTNSTSEMLNVDPDLTTKPSFWVCTIRLLFF